MTEELKQEFEEKFTYGAEILLYDAKGRFVRSIEAPKLWNWITDQIKQAKVDTSNEAEKLLKSWMKDEIRNAKIEENNYWINKKTIPNDIKFTNRISELKGE